MFMGLIYPINTQNSQDVKTQQYYLHTCTMVYGPPTLMEQKACHVKKRKEKENTSRNSARFEFFCRGWVRYKGK